MYNIKFFAGKLGAEKFILERPSDIIPSKGDIVGIGEECWEVIHTVIDYGTEVIENGKIHEISVFLKRYIWPDEIF